MKVLIINTSERTGGAAIAANRLMKALTGNGIEAKSLVLKKQSEDTNIISIQTSVFKKYYSQFGFLWERFVIFFCNCFSRKNLFQVSIANTGLDLSKHPLVKSADIIHIHWINQGLLSLNNIKKLIQTGKPVVWTLHDLWAGTGICHYPGDCEKYKNECYNCPLLQEFFLADLSKHTFIKKTKTDLQSIAYVGCSRWIAEKAKQSFLLKNAKITSIPNPINVNTFYPQNKPAVRKQLGLPADKKLLLFSAAKISDTRKGGVYFLNACNLICKIDSEWKNKTEIILMGNGDETFLSGIKMKVNTLRYVSGDENIAAIYAAADIFVIPSLEDNLPNTIMEAMACGTPCVGFDTGGIPEMIDHKKNGYVAQYRDEKDLAKGIQWVLNNSDTLNLSEACIKKVRDNYTEKMVATRYITLYNLLLNNLKPENLPENP
jgi:glycosyltransferase involved in cell wall biosynthesis